MARTKYLNNRDLMAEIHKSKCSYSSFIDDKYAMYDCIVIPDLNESEESYLKKIDSELIKETRINKADRLVKSKKHENKQQGIKEDVPKIDPESLPIEELIFRIMTRGHIPIDPDKERKVLENLKNDKIEKPGDRQVKCNFDPFKHYIIESYDVDKKGEYINLVFKEVGRSHWEGGLHNGHFSSTHGRITNNLASMFMKLTERYALRGNWRGYSYIDEMKSQAHLQLSQVGLQFNEAKSSNPFSYYTETINNSFTRVLNIEKRNQSIRDDLLVSAGSNPSFTRQIEHEQEMKNLEKEAGWFQPTKPARRGRKKSVSS